MTTPGIGTWTRRRFGVIASGLVASFGGWPAFEDVRANRQHKKKRCKKLGERCNPEGKRKCCHNHLCFTLDTDFACCKVGNESCHGDEECCSLSCDSGFCMNI